MSTNQSGKITTIWKEHLQKAIPIAKCNGSNSDQVREVWEECMFEMVGDLFPEHDLNAWKVKYKGRLDQLAGLENIGFAKFVEDIQCILT